MIKEQTMQDRRPLLTAVMPVYNGERYLRETLEHILRTVKDLEVILIDDGSSDMSAAICREYEAADRRIRYVRQENRGISESRNHGLMLARGEYICFWDQDDIVLPEGYAALLSKIRAAGADMGMCSTKRMIRGQMSVFEKIAEGTYSGGDIRTKLLYPLLFRGYTYSFVQGTDYLYGSVWKCIFRTDFIREQQIRFRRFVSYEDDWIFVTHALCRADKAVASGKAGYCWRVNGESESHKGAYIPDLDRRFRALDAYVNAYLEKGIRDAGVLTAYRKVSMCEHYVELCGNGANIRYAQGAVRTERRQWRKRMRNYLRETDYKSCLVSRKHLRSSAYRRRIVLFVLRYGGAEAARIVSGLYGWLERRLENIRWVARMERRHKMT